MSDDIPAPLAAFAGAVPPAPAWFAAAMADAPEASAVTVAGAAIEVLTWGQRGAPGLLFLHGNGAHAGWWRFIAPFFAATHRVAAMSWSGMGRSDHRADYDIATFVAEIAAVVAATGLAAAGPPLVVGHSFGGFPMMAAAGPLGDDLSFAGAVIVDTPFRLPDEPGERPPNATMRVHRTYPDLASALARFRFAPVQGCPNPFIADAIARESLVEVPDGPGGAATGYTWRFDPFLWGRFRIGDTVSLLDRPRCPVALIWGERSRLMPPANVAAMRERLPPGSPAFAIPDAEHHVMVDQPLAFVAALRGLFAGWPGVA